MKALRCLLLVLVTLGSAGAAPAPLTMDRSRARPLEAWKQQIVRYSQRHYGEAEWKLTPRCVVLHYTAGTSFPWNLVRETSFAGEPPGLASHYVVDGDHVWELVPPTVRSRGAYGINHRAINIEMVGADAADMRTRTRTLDTSARLVTELLQRFHLTPDDVYSHQQVATMDTQIVPWVLDRVNAAPYHKPDPGEASMAYILGKVRRQFQEVR